MIFSITIDLPEFQFFSSNLIEEVCSTGGQSHYITQLGGPHFLMIMFCIAYDRNDELISFA
ncbi:MAG TPA: hypothetical protein DD706_04865 [Nitrospiraceae bacterium]|nr:hypothetical protein [Nitrospiraceae bacterium]